MHTLESGWGLVVLGMRKNSRACIECSIVLNGLLVLGSVRI